MQKSFGADPETRPICQLDKISFAVVAVALWIATLAFPEIAGVATMVANEGRCRPIAARGHGLNRIVNSGIFRIRYTESRKDAVKHDDDINGNGVPDAVDDLSRQLDSAYDYYTHVVGLKSPLLQPRYRRARTIKVLVRRLDQRNGLSFDEVVREAGESDCELLIVVGAQLDFSRNATAAHELFHLFQYGYAMFKVPWYLEGMARWMEEAFFQPNEELPGSGSENINCYNILGDAYSASRFWNSAAAMFSKDKVASLPQGLQRVAYVNGRKVFQNNGFRGEAVLPVLDALQKLSLDLSDGSPSMFDWQENVQRSHRFDQKMCRSIESVLATVR